MKPMEDAARELAEEIGISHLHIETIRLALIAARTDALEEAAKVMDDHVRYYTTNGSHYGVTISKSAGRTIRALKEQQP